MQMDLQPQLLLLVQKDLHTSMQKGLHHWTPTSMQKDLHLRLLQPFLLCLLNTKRPFFRWRRSFMSRWQLSFRISSSSRLPTINRSLLFFNSKDWHLLHLQLHHFLLLQYLLVLPLLSTGTPVSLSATFPPTLS